MKFTYIACTSLALSLLAIESALTPKLLQRLLRLLLALCTCV